jgi:hypothetical protein
MFPGAVGLPPGTSWVGFYEDHNPVSGRDEVTTMTERPTPRRLEDRAGPASRPSSSRRESGAGQGGRPASGGSASAAKSPISPSYGSAPKAARPAEEGEPPRDRGLRRAMFLAELAEARELRRRVAPRRARAAELHARLLRTFRY